MTERKTRQNLAKCCNVSLQNCAKVNKVAQVLEKNILLIGSEIWYMFEFSGNIVVIIVQSGRKLHNFTILVAGVKTEQ